MRNWATTALLMGPLLMGALAVSTLQAQPGRSQGARSQGGRSRGGFGVPAAGTTLKNVKLYDDQGKPFQLSQLQGNYSVITFGCLT